MKTMIFVGSANRNGHTMALVNELCTHLQGSIEIINVFDYLDVKPCIDCGYSGEKLCGGLLRCCQPYVVWKCIRSHDGIFLPSADDHLRTYLPKGYAA